MRTSLFNFFDLFRAGGIGDEKKQPRFSDDIQLVSIAQDLIPRGGGGGSGFVPGYFVQDTPVAEFGVDVAIAALAAEAARVELLPIATGNGAWVIVNTSESNMASNIWTIAAFSGLGTTLLPTAANSSSFGTGGAATAIFEFGTAVKDSPANALRINPGNSQVGWSQNLTLRPIWVGPGRVFVFQSTANNAQADIGLWWREIP